MLRTGRFFEGCSRFGKGRGVLARELRRPGAGVHGPETWRTPGSAAGCNSARGAVSEQAVEAVRNREGGTGSMRWHASAEAEALRSGGRSRRHQRRTDGGDLEKETRRNRPDDLGTAGSPCLHGGQQRLGRRFPVGDESHRLVDPRVDGPQLVGQGGDTMTDRGLALDDVVRGLRRNGVRANPEPSGDG